LAFEQVIAAPLLESLTDILPDVSETDPPGA
jgi:hypothetical protein